MSPMSPMSGQTSEQASYILGYELGRALVFEARDILMNRAERAERRHRKEDTPAGRASYGEAYTIRAASRLARRLVHRSQKARAMASLRGDHNTAAWHFGMIDGARSALL